MSHYLPVNTNEQTIVASAQHCQSQALTNHVQLLKWAGCVRIIGGYQDGGVFSTLPPCLTQLHGCIANTRILNGVSGEKKNAQIQKVTSRSHTVLEYWTLVGKVDLGLGIPGLDQLLESMGWWHVGWTKRVHGLGSSGTTIMHQDNGYCGVGISTTLLNHRINRVVDTFFNQPC